MLTGNGGHRAWQHLLEANTILLESCFVIPLESWFHKLPAVLPTFQADSASKGWGMAACVGLSEALLRAEPWHPWKSGSRWCWYQTDGTCLADLQVSHISDSILKDQTAPTAGPWGRKSKPAGNRAHCLIVIAQ